MLYQPNINIFILTLFLEFIQFYRWIHSSVYPLLIELLLITDLTEHYNNNSFSRITKKFIIVMRGVSYV